MDILAAFGFVVVLAVASIAVISMIRAGVVVARSLKNRSKRLG